MNRRKLEQEIDGLVLENADLIAENQKLKASINNLENLTVLKEALIQTQKDLIIQIQKKLKLINESEKKLKEPKEPPIFFSDYQ